MVCFWFSTNVCVCVCVVGVWFLINVCVCVCCSIEGEFVPLPGDQVRYRLCPIPPKLEKCQAVHVEIINLTPQVHLRWDSPEN